MYGGTHRKCSGNILSAIQEMAANNLKSTSISGGNWTTLKWVRRKGEVEYTIIRWQLNRKIISKHSTKWPLSNT